MLRRCGLLPNDVVKDRRIFNQHNHEEIVVFSTLEIDGKVNKIKLKLKVPQTIGRQSTLGPSSEFSKGIGVERKIRNIARTYCE